MSMEETIGEQSRGTLRWLPARLLRDAGIGLLAGFAAGFVAGGIGSRLAMKVVALVAGPSAQGRITENGNTIGVFSRDTIFLLIFGTFLGGAGGLIYMALRPWLPKAARWRGLTFGAVLLATFGTAVIEGRNFDFSRFGNPVLNVALFGALFLLFGVLVAPLAERADRLFPRVPPQRRVGPGTVIAYVALAGSGLLGLFLVVAAGVSSMDGQQEDRHLTALFLALLAVALVARLVLAIRAGADGVPSAGDRKGWFGRVPALALGIPVLVGLVFTVRAVATILGV
jgi:hypothetical protein